MVTVWYHPHAVGDGDVKRSQWGHIYTDLSAVRIVTLVALCCVVLSLCYR
jgi:hypothetical protein